MNSTMLNLLGYQSEKLDGLLKRMNKNRAEHAKKSQTFNIATQTGTNNFNLVLTGLRTEGLLLGFHWVDPPAGAGGITVPIGSFNLSIGNLTIVENGNPGGYINSNYLFEYYEYLFPIQNNQSFNLEVTDSANRTAQFAVFYL